MSRSPPRQHARSKLPPTGGGNRPTAPDLFVTEILDAVELLARWAPSTEVVDEVDGKAVRKVRLPRSRYALYFTVEGDLVTVHALWHLARGSGPPLP